jgi:hypothetical protein
MKKALLIIGGLSVLGFGIYKYFKTQADLLLQFTWDFKGFKIKKFSLSEIALDLSIVFRSKANIEAKITKLYLDAFLDGKNVGYVSEDTIIYHSCERKCDYTSFHFFEPKISNQ